MKKKTKVFGKKKKKDIPFEPKPYYYTQRDWDRAVGWGKVPKEYQYPGLDYSDK